jgi:hypothetical protein
MKRSKRVFRVEDNPRNRGNEPLVLIDDTDTVVRVHDTPRVLIDIALETLGADVVIHGAERWELE